MATFFVDRPVFAWVIAIIIMVAGGISVTQLPVAQYPAIAPPTISVRTVYPGASATTLERTVTQVIEQRMNGLDGMRSIASASDSTGTVTIDIAFEPGTDPDIAQVQVQNKLQLAMPRLPEEVQRQGVSVAKSNRNFLLIAAFVSQDASMSRVDITDYVVSTLQDPISRVPGVGDVQIFGAPYAMRIWLHPDKLTSFKLTTLDVMSAIREQNAQVSAGQFGGVPALPGQRLNATITVQTRLETPEEFGGILLRVNEDGSRVHLTDVARIELTGETFEIESFYNGKPSGALGIRLGAGANALRTADAFRDRLDELSASFPPGLKVVYPIDTTPFVRISIEEVVKTLIEAVVLVFLVMLLFLQSLRATLIPMIAVPVVLLGTFGVLAVFGYSINTLTMFGMVLAIGLLVDDAIVVVENVERIMTEEQLSPKEATRRSMGQISGALVGIGLVLSAVFIPMAFFSGSVGVIYRQFSITLVSAMALSVLVALTLSPALCATIIKPTQHNTPQGARKRGLFGVFNRIYGSSSNWYHGQVKSVLRHRKIGVAVYVAIAAALFLLLHQIPTAFLPDEDQGTLYAQAVLPPGSTLEQTRAATEKMADHFLKREKRAVESVLVVNGFSFIGRGQNAGIAFIKLRPWDERETASLSAQAVVGRAMKALSKVREAQTFAFAPPPIRELGNATGFQLQLVDRAGLGHGALMEARDELIKRTASDARVTRVRANNLDDRPEYRINVDQEQAMALGLSVYQINSALSAVWGGAYVNDFIHGERSKRVYLQGDAPYRMGPEDLSKWYLRNQQGDMVPFPSFASGEWGQGPPNLDRYNGFATIAIQGEAAAGLSSGDAMSAMEAHASKLPAGIGYEWSGLSLEERLSGDSALALFVLSLLIVFLSLAALYESWSVPLSVILVVPIGVIGAVLATWFGGMNNDVYFKIGVLATMGLAAKNAILIVAFAKELRDDKGMTAVDAALEATRLRLRPIVMTSLAFTLGVLPLALSSGAGAGAQNAIGVAVVGGVISATVLGTLLVPLFFVLIVGKKKRKSAVEQ